MNTQNNKSFWLGVSGISLQCLIFTNLFGVYGCAAMVASLIVCLFAVITGHMARRELAGQKNLSAQKKPIGGLILGYFGMGWVAIVANWLLWLHSYLPIEYR